MALVPDDYIPQSVRAIIIGLMNEFNGIKVYDFENGAIARTLKVPIQLAEKEKYQALLLEDESGQKYYPKYPKLSLSWISTQYNGERAKGTNVTRMWYNSLSALSDVDSFISDVNPVPYDLGFELSIRTQSLSHFTQILEQILPYFDPARHIRIKEFRFLNIERNVKVRLDGISQEFLVEQEETVRRYVNGTLNLTCEAHMYRGFSDESVIKDINLNLIEGGVDDGLSAMNQIQLSGWDSTSAFPTSSYTYSADQVDFEVFVNKDFDAC